MSLRDEIQNDPLGIGYAAMSNGEVESSLNAKTRTRLVETYIGYGTVLSVLGAEDGAALLDALESMAVTNSAVKWAMKLLASDKLNIADPVTQGQVDALVVAGVLTAQQAITLKSLGVQPCSRAEEIGVTALDSDVRNSR